MWCHRVIGLIGCCQYQKKYTIRKVRGGLRRATCSGRGEHLCPVGENARVRSEWAGTQAVPTSPLAPIGAGFRRKGRGRRGSLDPWGPFWRNVSKRASISASRFGFFLVFLSKKQRLFPLNLPNNFYRFFALKSPKSVREKTLEKNPRPAAGII